MATTMEQIVNLAKQRGFVFPGSEIYGGLANTWDYGPLGVELKNNIKKAWWKKYVQESQYNVGLDASILMNPKTWEASGHLSNFNDPMMDCKDCKSRHRADKLLESQIGEDNIEGSIEALSFDEMEELIKTHHVKCPNCGSQNFTPIRQFNLMFKTYQGVTETSTDEIYLRPETAQGIFVNFKNVQRTMRKKVPFGIAQIGKSFRNEITPGNFTFRTREFEQLELEFFCKPGEEEKWFDYWRAFSREWLLSLNMKAENVTLRDHEEEELPHYSKGTTDIEYKFPFGWGELSSISSRTDYDLKRHMEVSGEDMQYIDQATNERYLPYVIEPSLGADRVTLAFLIDAFEEEEINEKETRSVLRFHPAIAPYKAAILPLSKKLSDDAYEVFQTLSKTFMVDFDETGSIGKRYRRQDEIGTPYCITYDFDSREDGQVTVRHRDTMEQVRLPIAEVADFLKEKIQF
ncbi:glycyl-tRNA synthetase [Pullulanibacillus pueri]|uniref:Glycine--tRNA ligase n=1 Tax=Pullulanibacillus pueri TaxID=1437324 RepID=A0A8J2ZVS2_9BACL|nr:glycine--tRNA ligase [Pullulanibacillus pueri]MBM7682179.1 glycyl-tRNA synthetase [Pullulanibacillus pueri]GGH80342.1 glycine--tRNA ligase [Pullulanibacillus pueri]